MDFAPLFRAPFAKTIGDTLDTLGQSITGIGQSKQFQRVFRVCVKNANDCLTGRVGLSTLTRTSQSQALCLSPSRDQISLSMERCWRR